MVFVTTGPAGAAAATPSCKTQTGTATLTPGLTNTARAQTLSSTSKFSACTGGGVTSGSAKSTEKLAKASGSCANLAKTGVKTAITETITWNNKKTSTASGTAATGPKAGQATITLKITKGLFVGKTASTVIAFTPGKGQDCSAAHPIKQLTLKGIKPFAIK